MFRSLRKKCCRIAALPVLCLLPALSRPAAQEAADAVLEPHRVVSFEHVNQELVLKCDVGRLVIKPYADNVIQVRYLATPAKAAQPPGSTGATPVAVKYRVDSTLAGIRLALPQMSVNVDRKTAQITFYDPKQNVLLASKTHQLKGTRVAGGDATGARAEFLSPDDESFYGLGLQPNGWMDLRGKTVQIRQDSAKTDGDTAAIPFLVTNRKYGFVFDGPARTTVMPGGNGITSWEAEGGTALSYFVIAGATADEIYGGYRLLTGTAPLPPKSAFGCILSAQQPVSQAQLLEAARKYKEKEYPADILAIGAGETGPDPRKWPDPAAMNAELGKMGLRIADIFPAEQAKASYEEQRRELTARVLNLTRSAFLGSQQYGTIMVPDSGLPQWEALKRQIPAGLSLAASGIPYWAAAMGAGPPSDVELFLRWIQFSAFNPVFRTHGALLGIPNWDPGQAAGKIIARYLNLRYRLLPYIYSLAHSVTETGAPITRALFMDFPQDEAVGDIPDEYMFGPALLVAPVAEKGKTNREVYLPKGTVWYDYWTGKKFPGGQRVLADAPLDTIPLFVRAGSIIPHGNEIANTRTDQREVELRVYAGADGRFGLYQDDGAGYEYEKGKFSIAQLRWIEATQQLTVTGDDRRLFARPREQWLKVVR